MARVITGTIYKITYTETLHRYIECDSETDLFTYIAREQAAGYIVTSVNEICRDGSTPRVKVLTDKRYKEIYKALSSR